jgi:hypothetical protein
LLPLGYQRVADVLIGKHALKTNFRMIPVRRLATALDSYVAQDFGACNVALKAGNIL